MTTRVNARKICEEGFRGGWGDNGFGVYLFGTRFSASDYMAMGGWDGETDPGDLCIIEVGVARDEVLEIEIDPEWPNPEDYEHVLYRPMDPDDEEALWVPEVSFLDLTGNQPDAVKEIEMTELDVPGSSAAVAAAKRIVANIARYTAWGETEDGKRMENPEADYLDGQDETVESLIDACRLIRKDLPASAAGLSEREERSVELVRTISEFAKWEEHPASRELELPDTEYLDGQHHTVEELIRNARNIVLLDDAGPISDPEIDAPGM